MTKMVSIQIPFVVSELSANVSYQVSLLSNGSATEEDQGITVIYLYHTCTNSIKRFRKSAQAGILKSPLDLVLADPRLRT